MHKKGYAPDDNPPDPGGPSVIRYAPKDLHEGFGDITEGYEALKEYQKEGEVTKERVEEHLYN